MLFPYGLSQSSFCSSAIARFPQAGEAGDSTHLVMGGLANVVRSSIRRQDLTTAVSVFAFLEECLAHESPDPEIQNAVWISFIEVDEFKSGPQWRDAAALLPPRLQACLVETSGKPKRDGWSI